MPSLTLDWTTFALEVVNFLILLWLLQRFLYRPIAASVARRRAEIDRELAAGRDASTAAAALKQQYEGRLADWEREKAEARTRLSTDLQAERARQMQALSGELERERTRREAAQTHERDSRESSLRQAARRDAAAFAANLLGRMADAVLEAKIVALAAEDLERLPANRREALDGAAVGEGAVARVWSAFGSGDHERLASAIRSLAGHPVSLSHATDTSLIAGVRIELGAWVLAANLRDELAFFAEALESDG
jgi:F-type H+-transporting ATPase subunit b